MKLGRTGRARTLFRGSATLTAVAVAGLIAAACGSSGSTGATATTSGASTAGAVRGGTLTIVGSGDVDYFDTAAAYYDVTYVLLRAVSRQLYVVPTKALTSDQASPVPDLATAMPTVTNGGKTYTVHIRQGAMWDTTPPRQVTAADVVLGFKRLCNPTSPTGAPSYFETTIVGMKAYCDGFGKVAGTVDAEKTYIQGNDVPGLKAVDPSTIQFNLLQPAPDFINILAMTFSSPVPVEFLNYLPSSVALAQHWVSDGPYSVQSYTPNTSITLVRNKAWKASSDPVRPAYVDEIDVKEGVANTPAAAVQQIQAGTADMEWDQNVAPAQLAGMEASHDPNLLIGPEGASNYLNLNPVMNINLQSPNNGGALKKLQVRQAIEYAINKTADSQVYGGPAISKPLGQAVPAADAGYIPGYDPYPNSGGNGDPAKAKALLAQAGYGPSNPLTLTLVYRTNTVHPQIAQTDQAALQAAGIKVNLVPVPPSSFYTQYLENPTASQAGKWDIGETGWNPDWLGNNGRSMIEALYDGRTYGKNSVNYGDVNSPQVNAFIDKALSASSVSQALTYWQDAAREVMAEALIVPIGQQKTAIYHSTRLQNCVWNTWINNCDPTTVWIKK